MHTSFTTLIVGLLAALPFQAQAQYTLDTHYDLNNFFNEFSFFTDSDPTHGHVNYVNQETANQFGLAGERDGAIHMAVDATEFSPQGGRKSVRLTSNKQFTHGLFIADINHMPGSTCGSWPAFWMFGPDWPASGEIDIIEGVNTQTSTAVTLHTSPGCRISNEGTDPSTVLKEADCNYNNAFGGCGQQTSNKENYGDGLNLIGGGVYAMEWTSEHIAVWFFPRYSIPENVVSDNPDPSTWGFPIARFVAEGGTGCVIDNFFIANSIVINTTFCGDWAAAVWESDPLCSALAPTCVEYVDNNPAAFENAYWSVNSVRVFQQPGPVNGKRSHVHGKRHARGVAFKA